MLARLLDGSEGGEGCKMLDVREKLPNPSKHPNRVSVPSTRLDDILCITQSPWDGPKRVRHNLMREYAKRGHRVLFVEAWLTWLKLLRGVRYWKAAANLLRGPRLTKDGVYAVMVPPHFPGGEWIRWISVLNWEITRWWLNHITQKQLPLVHPRLFIFAPQADSLVGKFHESCAVYFCNDPFKRIFPYPSAQANLEAMENELTQRVDIVLAVSEQLMEERKQHNPHTYLIPLAANVELFGKAMDDSLRIPEDLQRSPKPVFGYVGVLNTRIDVDLMQFIARQMPNASFVFVGPIIEVPRTHRRKLESLQQLKNVFFLGDKSEEDLPAYLKGVDVCIIPYLRDEVTKYIKANAKFFQYVTSGRPVVSTIGPYEFDEDIVINCSTAEEFAYALQRALTLTSEEHRLKRRALAQQHSWSARVDAIEQILSSHKKKKLV